MILLLYIHFRSNHIRKAPRGVEKCLSPNCYTDIKPDWKFCSNCGAAIVISQPLDEDFSSLKRVSTSSLDRCAHTVLLSSFKLS